MNWLKKAWRWFWMLDHVSLETVNEEKRPEPVVSLDETSGANRVIKFPRRRSHISWDELVKQYEREHGPNKPLTPSEQFGVETLRRAQNNADGRR